MNLDKTFSEARKASRALLGIDKENVDNLLRVLADVTVERAPFILDENRKDLARMDPANPKYDRLKLTEGRLHEIADGLRKVAASCPTACTSGGSACLSA